jgi:hypothetical protein
MKFLLPSALLVIVSTASFAQPYAREVESIPVALSTETLSQPWTGGINTPTIQFVDIDGDGDKDLFVFHAGSHVDFYRNEGTASTPNFKLRPIPFSLPSFNVWFLFVDITADGLSDLFTDNGGFGMRYYRNDGTPQLPLFTLVADTMFDCLGDPINAGSYSYPAFADIDGDAKIDFFSCNIIGTINFYRNVGTPNNPLFCLVTDAWQNILFISNVSCCPSYAPSQSTEGVNLHGTCALLFGDIGNDNDNDMLWGDLYHDGIAFFRNQGTPQVPVMVLQDSCFPPNDPVCTSAGGNQSVLVDIDGDGDLDFFVGAGVVSGANVPRHGFIFYENIGTPSSPVFVRRTSDYLSILDVGMYSHPTFVDIDGDGKSDLFVGTSSGQLWYFRNTGTTQNPSFQLVDTVFAAISGGFMYAPAFVDIDSDGDRDLFLGLYDGRMRFYRNTGTQTNPEFVREVSPVDTIFAPYEASPTFSDIDGDGDVDLFIGMSNGRIRFYRNVGSVTNFVPILESTQYQNIIAGQSAKPVFYDMDGDGDYDLFIGTSEGRVEFYENTGTAQEAQFIRRTNHYANTDPMLDAAPAFVDIDGDGDTDLFVGTRTGGIHFYRNNFITSVGELPRIPQALRLYQNYPNPFNPRTNIGFEVPGPGFVSLKVYDLLGREIATLVNGTRPSGFYEIVFDAPTHLVSGIYLYRLTFIPEDFHQPKHQESRKLILLR